MSVDRILAFFAGIAILAGGYAIGSNPDLTQATLPAIAMGLFVVVAAAKDGRR